MTISGFEMKSFDSLVGLADEADCNVVEIPLEDIDDFKNHPFRVIDNEDMEQLAESVRINGIINPAIVREKPNGRYELISGHRRKRACELAGLTTLKCEVCELSDDEATIFMVDSNIQRSSILPSEKAFSYKMRLDAIKRRNENGAPLGHLKSRDILSDETGESREQIRRYIRLTELIPQLLELVDKSKIKIRPAVEISYLSKDLQEQLYDIIERSKAYPSQAQAEKMKVLYQTEELNANKMAEIMEKKKKPAKDKNEIAIPYAAVKDYFPGNYGPEQILDEIIKMIQNTAE